MRMMGTNALETITYKRGPFSTRRLGKVIFANLVLCSYFNQEIGKVIRELTVLRDHGRPRPTEGDGKLTVVIVGYNCGPKRPVIEKPREAPRFQPAFARSRKTMIEGLPTGV
jgi:hypothetical protein